MDSRLLAFTGVATLITIVPGPDMAIVLRDTLRSGTRTGIVTSAGICSGLIVWGMASSVGISALLATSAELFEALKLLGAAYLVFLGVTTLLASRHRAGDEGESRTAAATGRAAFRQGLLSNLLNPKIGVFYTTLLPQFVAPGQPVLARTILLASIHAVTGLVWLAAYAHAVTRVGDVIRRPHVRAWIERATGAVLVALGARVAADAV